MAEVVAVVGSRTYRHLDRVRSYVQGLPPGTTLISGGARGVDRAAENEASSLGLEVVSLLPDWDRYGKCAGFRRNREVVERCERMVAFWSENSSGTANAIAWAVALGKSVEVVLDDS